MATPATTTTCATVSRACSLTALLLCLLSPALADDPRTRDYTAIDAWARQAPAAEAESPARLAQYLARPARDDFDKARALFTWLATHIDYDVAAFLSGQPSSNAAGDVLRSGRSVCQGYSNLFEQMAEVLGLEVATIQGWGKGYGYQPGQALGDTNHAWNAIQIGDAWYLLDATWGAGYVDGAQQYVRKFEPFYFLTPPDQFSYSHLPEDEKWQLLDPPLTVDEFVTRARMEPSFFRLGFGLDTHPEAVIRTGPKLHLAFTAPEEAFMLAKLTLDGRDLTEKPLVGKRDGERIVFDLGFQRTATCELRIYGRTGDQAGMYDQILEYRLEVNADQP